MICTVSFTSNQQNPLLNILIINCTRVYFDWLSITKPKPKSSQTYIDIIMIGCSIWLNTQTSLHWLWHNNYYLQNCTNRFSSKMTKQLYIRRPLHEEKYICNRLEFPISEGSTPSTSLGVEDDDLPLMQIFIENPWNCMYCG